MSILRHFDMFFARTRAFYWCIGCQKRPFWQKVMKYFGHQTHTMAVMTQKRKTAFSRVTVDSREAVVGTFCLNQSYVQYHTVGVRQNSCLTHNSLPARSRFSVREATKISTLCGVSLFAHSVSWSSSCCNSPWLEPTEKRTAPHVWEPTLSRWVLLRCSREALL